MRTPVLRAAMLLALIAGVLAVAYTVDPQKTRWLPVCPFHAVTGLYCPGCGMLRCLHQLAHGRLVEALSLNVLVVLAAPLIAWVTVTELSEALGRRLPGPRNPRLALMLPVALALFGVARNLPVYPLYLLAPR